MAMPESLGDLLLGEPIDSSLVEPLLGMVKPVSTVRPMGLG